MGSEFVALITGRSCETSRGANRTNALAMAKPRTSSSAVADQHAGEADEDVLQHVVSVVLDRAENLRWVRNRVGLQIEGGVEKSCLPGADDDRTQNERRDDRG